MFYTFLTNEEKDAEGRNVGFFGYQHGHALRVAYTGTIDEPGISDAIALNRLFERFNIGHPADYRGRSMSVGDVVILRNGDEEPRSYACESVGWLQIPAHEPAKVRVTTGEARP